MMEPGGDTAWPCPSPPSHRFPPHGPVPAPRGRSGLPCSGCSWQQQQGQSPQPGRGVQVISGAVGYCQSSEHPHDAWCGRVGQLGAAPARQGQQGSARQSGKPPASTEEKHPLYYRPQEAPVAGPGQFYTGHFHFQQGKEKRGTKPTNPTHCSFVLENTHLRGREKPWVRGAPAEKGRDLRSPPPGDACEELAMHLETHEQQTHLAAPARTYPAHPSAAGEPPSQQPLSHSHPRPTRATVPGGLSDWNLVAGEEGGGRGSRLARVPPHKGLGGGPGLCFTLLLAQQQWAPWSTCLRPPGFLCRL